jgi:hypothetical protein
MTPQRLSASSGKCFPKDNVTFSSSRALAPIDLDYNEQETGDDSPEIKWIFR